MDVNGKGQGQVSAFGLALAGFALLPVGDAIVKSMASEWPGTAIAALRYFFGALAIAALLAVREGRAGFVCPRPWIQLGRAAGVSVSAAAFFAGVQIMPLAEMTAISFTSPIIVAILSAQFLGEPTRRAVWVATGVAFAGMLILLRPDIGKIGWAGVLPLISAAGFAVMILFNRMAAGHGSALQMQMLITALALPLLAGIALAGHMSGIRRLLVTAPDWTVALRCAVIAVTASVSHTCLYMATERATAAAIGPVVYVQLLVALVLGMFFFGDQPDSVGLGGAALIIAAGLYLWRAGSS